MINYPSGIKKVQKQKEEKSVIKARRSFSSSNRGMFLEEEINITNEYYKKMGKCLITKRPTPIHVLKVDYSQHAQIVSAHFASKSTTDYNGVYKGRYIDFEAKSTKSKTSFPLANICEHQIEHLEEVLFHGGIAFFIIELSSLQETYFLDAKYVIDFYRHGERKSIPIPAIKENGHRLTKSFMPRLNYLDIIEKYYCK